MIEGSTTEKHEGSKSGDWGEDDEAMTLSNLGRIKL